MTVDTRDNLLTRANQVRTETGGYANTASRLGGLFRDIIDSLFGLPNYNVKAWGVRADGVTDDTTAMANALSDAKANGYNLVAPAGTIMIRELALGGGAKRWSLKGQGKGATIFKRISGGTSMNCGGSSVPFTLSDFTLNCNATAVPTSANHGISIGLASGVRIERVSIIDYAASACQLYDDSGTHQYVDNLVIDCDSDGYNIGQVGFLISNMDRSGLVRCFSKRNNVAPGFAVELKNVCHECYVTDCIGEDSIALLAFGNDTVNPGVERCTVSGFTGKAGASTTAGYIGGRAQFNTFSNIALDMNSGVGFALRLQNCIGETFRGVSVRNVGASRSAVYLENATTDCDIDLGHIDNINTTGTVVEFHASSLRNRVTLARMTTPLVRAAGLHTEATFNATTTNYYSHLGYTMYENLTIASGSVTPLNQATELIYLLGEGGAADNIETVVTTGLQSNRVLRLRASSPGTQPITVTTAGNIALNGGVSFAMDGRTDTFSMMWVSDSSGAKFGELARSNNG